MGVKRFQAKKDTTISNAFKSNLQTRATGSNMGASDILEVFTIYGQATSASVENSRILVEFDTGKIITERNSGRVAASGSSEFYLKLYNAKHVQTVPKDFYLEIQAVSGSWTEGTGLDMDEYKDIGKSNWISSSYSSSWVSEGGDYYTDLVYTKHFKVGTEDLEVNVTQLVEEWIDSTKDNHGFLIKLSSSHETDTTSYFTKKFFGRTSEYKLFRPVIEARWDSSTQDDRGNFYYSSSLAPAADNLNSLYLYNHIRGRLKNIPTINSGTIFVSLYSGTTGPTGSPLVLWNGETKASGAFDEVGVYKVDMALTASTTPLTKLFDVWWSGSVQYFTGSLVPKTFQASQPYPMDKFVNKITNLKPSYNAEEMPKLRIFSRQKNWNPNIYTKAVASMPPTIIEDGYFRVIRVADNHEVIPYGTGSMLHTKLSYDVSGNYFPLDMGIFEADYMYAIKLAYNIGNGFEEQSETFKFRVEKQDKFNQ
jgi:hypothetical protein